MSIRKIFYVSHCFLLDEFSNYHKQTEVILYYHYLTVKSIYNHSKQLVELNEYLAWNDRSGLLM